MSGMRAFLVPARGALLSVLAVLTAAAPAAAPVPPAATDPYRPLAFLVGHCWKGALPGGGERTDEHCFSRIYGGRFLRDEHTVHRSDGAADAFGESIYVWNSAAGRLEYLYIESAGGFSRGTVTVEGDALVFPDASYVEDGKTMTIRSRWQRVGADAYDVTTEFEMQGRWVPGFSLHMLRQPHAPT
jgi:hypothetical protein